MLKVGDMYWRKGEKSYVTYKDVEDMAWFARQVKEKCPDATKAQIGHLTNQLLYNGFSHRDYEVIDVSAFSECECVGPTLCDLLVRMGAKDNRTPSKHVAELVMMTGVDMEFAGGYVLSLGYLRGRERPVIALSKSGEYLTHALVKNDDGLTEFEVFFESLPGSGRKEAV